MGLWVYEFVGSPLLLLCTVGSVGYASSIYLCVWFVRHLGLVGLAGLAGCLGVCCWLLVVEDGHRASINLRC